MSTVKSQLYSVLTMLLVACLAGPCFAGRKHRERPPSKPAQIRQARLSIVGAFTVGKVTGKASEIIGDIEDGITYKLAYGLGLSAEYCICPRSAFAVSLEPVWKILPGDDATSIRTFSYSLSWLYRFSPHTKYSVTVRPQVGLLSATLPYDDGPDLDLETHPFFRIGVGLFAYSSGRTNTRFEVYYKHCFTDGHKLGGSGIAEIGFDAAMIGIELGIGIPLLSH